MYQKLRKKRKRKKKALEVYVKGNAPITGVRFGDKVVAGSRSMRATIDVRLPGKYVELTPDEKAANIEFYSSLNFVKQGSGNGNQQLIGGSYKSWAPNNRLFELQKKAEYDRYSGHLNTGKLHTEYIKKPTEMTKAKYGVCMVPQIQHNQLFMPLNPNNMWKPSQLNQPIKFNTEHSRKPNMFNQVYSPETRLYNGNIINGGIRV